MIKIVSKKDIDILVLITINIIIIKAQIQIINNFYLVNLNKIKINYLIQIKIIIHYKNITKKNMKNLKTNKKVIILKYFIIIMIDRQIY